MEVVVLTVTKGKNQCDGMCKSYGTSGFKFRMWVTETLTSCRWVLSKVTGLVSAKEALWLDFRGGTSWKLLIEAHNSLHTSGILRGTDTLESVRTFIHFVFKSQCTRCFLHWSVQASHVA